MTEIGTEIGTGTQISTDKIRPFHVLQDSISVPKTEEPLASETNDLTGNF